MRKNIRLFPSRFLATYSPFLSSSLSLTHTRSPSLSLSHSIHLFAHNVHWFLGTSSQQKTSNKFDVNSVGNVRTVRAREACVLYAQPEIWYCSFHKHCDFYKCTHYLLKAQSPSMLEMLRWAKIHKKGWIQHTATLPIHMHANGFVVQNAQITDCFYTHSSHVYGREEWGGMNGFHPWWDWCTCRIVDCYMKPTSWTNGHVVLDIVSIPLIFMCHCCLNLGQFWFAMADVLDTSAIYELLIDSESVQHFAIRFLT